MAEQRNLPGWPRKRLVKEVRSHLWRYGIRPKDEAWRATWAWASEIAHSYYRTRWPMANEIATQYILLLLTQMKESRVLRLPYRANTVIPDETRRLLPTTPLLLIERGNHKPDEAPASSSDNQLTNL